MKKHLRFLTLALLAFTANSVFAANEVGSKFSITKANGTKFIDRMRVRTPTFANLSGLVETLKGCDLADVPILVLTIDPCISCTER